MKCMVLIFHRTVIYQTGSIFEDHINVKIINNSPESEIVIQKRDMGRDIYKRKGRI